MLYEVITGSGQRGRIYLSAKTGEGIRELLYRMAKEILPRGSDILGEAMLTRLRRDRSYNFV